MRKELRSRVENLETCLVSWFFLVSPSPKESLEVVKAAAKRSKACGGLADLLEKAAEELGEGKVIHKSTELIPLLSTCGCEPKAGKKTLL